MTSSIWRQWLLTRVRSWHGTNPEKSPEGSLSAACQLSSREDRRAQRASPAAIGCAACVWSPVLAVSRRLLLLLRHLLAGGSSGTTRDRAQQTASASREVAALCRRAWARHAGNPGLLIAGKLDELAGRQGSRPYAKQAQGGCRCRQGNGRCCLLPGPISAPPGCNACLKRRNVQSG